MSLAGLENTSTLKLYVAVGLPSDYTAANLASLTWQEVAGFVDVGPWGGQNAVVSEPNLSQGVMTKTSGLFDGGTVPVTVQHLTTDAGGDLIKDNAGSAMTVIKKYLSGESEVTSGQFSDPQFRGGGGGAQNRGYISQFYVSERITELSAADTTTALA